MTSPTDGARRRTGNPPISLVVCTRNRAVQLERCLSRLPDGEIRELGAEVVLVDNGSTDGTAAVIDAYRRRADHPVKVLYARTPGSGRARNTGLTEAEADVIAFTDDDCYLGREYLSLAVDEFAKEAFDYCGGRIITYDPADSPYSDNLGEEREIIPPGAFFWPGRIQGANLIVRRRVFDTIGGFDPHFGAGTPFRADDLDLAGRASMAGFVGAHIPDLVVYHHHGRKPGATIRALERANDRSVGACYAKFIAAGHFNYLGGWLRRTASLRDPCKTGREIAGALRYLAFRCARRGEPRVETGAP